MRPQKTMKISKKKPYITSSVTTVKSSSIKGFPRFTVTDEQRIEATPKEGAGGSNPFWRANKRNLFFDEIKRQVSSFIQEGSPSGIAQTVS